MTRMNLTGLLLGATALALALGPAATAQQNTGQQTRQSGQMTRQMTRQMTGTGETGGAVGQASGQNGQQAVERVRDQLQEASKALDKEDADAAREALDQAEHSMQQLGQADSEAERQQAVSEVEAQVKEARRALDKDDLQGAQDALTAAEQALQKVQQVASARGADHEAGQQGRNAAYGSTETVPPAGDQDSQTAPQAPSPQPAGQSERTPRQADARATRDADMTQLSADETNRLLGMGDHEIGQAAEMVTLTPADLDNRAVVTMDGDEVGEVGDVVSSGGQLYAIIEHGGFLGIGEDRVAIPIDRIGLRGEDVILLGLNEAQLQRMPDYDYDADEAVAREQAIEIGRYE